MLKQTLQILYCMQYTKWYSYIHIKNNVDAQLDQVSHSKTENN